LIRIKAIIKVADTDFILRRADEIAFHNGFPLYELQGIGSFVDSTIGIIEPIVQAIMINMINEPELFDGVVKWIAQEKLYRVMHRFYIAARAVERLEGPESQKVAALTIRTFEKLVPEMVASTMVADKNDRAAKRRIIKQLRKAKKRKNGN
jgi:hypothetical protein